MSLPVRRAGSIGPLSLLGQAGRLSGVPPGQLGGKGRHFLSLPPSVPRGSERGGGPSRQAPIYVPQGRAAQLGEEAGEGRAELGMCSPLCLIPSPPTSAASEHSGAPAVAQTGQAHPRLISGPLLLLSPRPGVPFPQISALFVPCFIYLYSSCCCLRETVPNKPSEHNLTPQRVHLHLRLYRRSSHTT